MAQVLIVDDNAQVRSLVADVLAEAGLSVASASDGAEALEALQAVKPQVIVLDLQMPIMDGAEFFRRLRDNGDATPVLILSTYDARSAREELGADDALPKPFDIDELVDRVEALLPAGEG
jgi:DNA-binding response OmpR family regulator